MRLGATVRLGLLALEYVPPLLVLMLFVGRRRRTAIAAALLALCGLVGAPPARAATPTPAPPSTPAPTPAAAPAPAPATPLPTATPSSSPTVPPAPSTPTPTTAPAPTPATPPPPASAPTPAATATPNPFSYIITPAPVPATQPDGPHILEVDLNDRRIRAGGPLMVRVVTSANVVGVEARALGRFIAIPQSGPGVFGLIYTMPDGIPFWLLNRNYDIVIAAATADGRQTTVSFPMLLSR